jgi:hypothetical protein
MVARNRHLLKPPPLPDHLSCPPLVEAKEHTNEENTSVSSVTARSCKFFYSGSRLLAVGHTMGDSRASSLSGARRWREEADDLDKSLAVSLLSD